MQTPDVYLSQLEHGATARALCCPDPELHRRRLRLAAGLLSGLQLESVVDIGCGFADLATFLPPAVMYLGVDLTPPFIEQARVLHPDLQLIAQDGAMWLQLSETDSVDAVVALGVLATCEAGEMRLLLQSMRRVARRIVVVSWQERDEYQGSFNAWSREDIEASLGRAKALSSLMGDTEYTGAFLP